MLFAVGGGCYSPVSGGGDPKEYPGPELLESPPVCLFHRMVVATQHRDVTWTRRTVAVVRNRVVCVAAAGRTTAAGKATAPVTGLDETPHTRRHPITVVTMATTRLSAMDSARLRTMITARLNAMAPAWPSTTITARLSVMDAPWRVVWLWVAPAGLQIGQ